jgi:hypothetical protein
MKVWAVFYEPGGYDRERRLQCLFSTKEKAEETKERYNKSFQEDNPYVYPPYLIEEWEVDEFEYQGD